MNTYTVYFRSDAEYASHDIEAKTPQRALSLAQKLYREERSILFFDPYEGMDVNEIEVVDADGDEVAIWMSDDMRLRFAAQDLLDAAQKVVARWKRGDLAEAVRELAAAITTATGGAQ
jgi:hypothetical protein